MFAFLYKSLSLQCLHADASSWSRGGGDRHMDNSVFLRFGFDDSKSWENFNAVKNKATKNDFGYVVSIQPELCSLAYGVFAQ